MTRAARDDRTIYQRMIAIIGDLPAIGKTQRNEEQKFMFRGQDDVLNALNPLLPKHGVFIMPNVLERTTARRETAKGRIMFEVNLHVQFTFFGAAGDSVVGSAWGEGTDMGDKATNKAMTMAFKYVLNQAFAINTEEQSKADADKTTPEETVAGRGAPEEAARQEDTPVQKPTQKQKKDFKDRIEQLAQIDPEKNWVDDVIEPWVLKETGGKSIADLSRGGYDILLNKVDKLLERARQIVHDDVPFGAPPNAEDVAQAVKEEEMEPSDLPLTGVAAAAEDEDIPFGNDPEPPGGGSGDGA